MKESNIHFEYWTSLTDSAAILLQLFQRNEEGVSIVHVLVVLFVCALSYLIARMLIARGIKHLVQQTETAWDDILVRQKLFRELSYFAPGVVLYFGANVFPEVWVELIQRLTLTYMVVVGIIVLDSILSAVLEIYAQFERAKTVPIKGFVQAAKLLIFLFGAILAFATIMGKEPWALLAGVGALMAVLLLVFKNSILSLVANIQITSGDLVDLGDWIHMPKFGADGDVIDVGLHTVKVQNFDKTVTTIPTCALVTDSFRNWRGMQRAGGRRIKRSICIDVRSVELCTEEMIERLKRIHFLSDYFEQKQDDIESYHRSLDRETFDPVNNRRLTNLGTFRAYVKEYLSHHPDLQHDMTCLVRHLAPTEFGLPIEIYAFTNDTAWVRYESIQADIFEHLLAIVPEFGLRIFQNPTGDDLKSWASPTLDNQNRTVASTASGNSGETAIDP